MKLRNLFVSLSECTSGNEIRLYFLNQDSWDYKGFDRIYGYTLQSYLLKLDIKKSPTVTTCSLSRGTQAFITSGALCCKGRISFSITQYHSTYFFLFSNLCRTLKFLQGFAVFARLVKGFALVAVFLAQLSKYRSRTNEEKKGKNRYFHIEIYNGQNLFKNVGTFRMGRSSNGCKTSKSLS